MTIAAPGAYPTYHLPPRDVRRAQPPSNLGEWIDFAQGTIILMFIFEVVLIAMYTVLSLLLRAFV